MAIRRVTENSVNQAGYTRERVQAADFASGGEAIARGGAALGQGVTQVGEAIDKIGEMYDTAAVKKADADDLEQIMKIRAQALTAEGFDAQTAIENARTQIAQIGKSRMASLHNPRQQRMYQDVFAARQLQIEETFTNHSIKQTAAANKGAAVARAEQYTDFAVDTYGTPAFESNLQTVMGEITTANPGAGADAIARAQAKTKSAIYSRIISTKLANPDQVLDAQTLLEQHAADILPDDEEKLRRGINPLMEEVATDALIGEAFGTLQSGPEGPVAPSDPLAPQPEGERSSSTASRKPYHPLGGVGRTTDRAADHRARKSQNGLDYAAPEGAPIKPPMSGKVTFNGWTEKGGWTVIVEHPNGYVTGYAHMRGKSALDVGAPVERSTVIGGVGSTGKSTGNHLHFTVRKSKGGPKVDPETVNWAASDTVAPDKVSWKESKLVLAQPNRNSVEAALTNLNRIAVERNLSQREYNRAAQGIMAIGNRNESLYNKRQDELYRGALEKVVELDDGLTSRSQIPGFGNLDPQHQLTIDNIIKQNVKGPSEEEKAGSGRYFELVEQMYSDPEGFAKADILKEPSLSNGERKSLFSSQSRLRNDPQQRLAAQLGDANGAASRYLPKDVAPEKLNLFRDRYMAEVERQQGQFKRPLTGQERDAIARSMTVEAVRYQGDKPIKGQLFEYQPGRGDTRATVNFEEVYSSIPPAVHDQIVRGLRERGERHSKQDVVRVFLRLGR